METSPKVYTRDELEQLTRNQLDEIAAERAVAPLHGTGPDGAVADVDVINAILVAQQPDPPQAFDPPAETPTPPDIAEAEAPHFSPAFSDVNLDEDVEAEDADRLTSSAVPLTRGIDGAVPVTHVTRRSSADVLPGKFGRVTAGPHVGRVGVFESTVSIDTDGYPEVVLVRLRDTGAMVTVDYANLEPA